MAKKTYSTHKLKNGVTLLLELVDYYSSTNISFYNKIGSRNELADEAGYSHFVEHMLFKGTKDYSKKEISTNFDMMGGCINAYTGREEVVIHNRVPPYDLDECIKMMASMYNDSLFDSKEVESERNVILSEFDSSREDPEDQCWENFMTTIVGDIPLGRSILGTKETLANVTSESLLAFYNKHFIAENLVISITGKFDAQAVIDCIESIEFRHGAETPSLYTEQPTIKYGSTQMNSELVHVNMGRFFGKLPYATGIRFDFISAVIGENISSRLFEYVRDELGLCYSINSQVSFYRDEVFFSIYFSVDKEKLDDTVEAINRTLSELVKNGITDDELVKYKRLIACAKLFSEDNIRGRMNSNLHYHVFTNEQWNRTMTSEEFAKLEKDEINDAIRLLFQGSEFYTHTLYKSEIEEIKWTF